MMMASMMGAIAFQKDLGAVHSCAHALGAVCDLHHGLANALMIDTVLAWNLEAAPAQVRRAGACLRRGRRRAGLRALAERAQGARSASRGDAGRASASSASRSRALVEIAVADICHQTNPRPV